MPQKRIPTIDRYWAKVAKSSDEACWLWIGGKDKDGYGIFWDGTYTPSGRGHDVRVTRWAYEQFIGPLPSGMNVCHTCDTPSCCNPAHFFAGSHKENHEDRERKGRGGQWMTRGESHVNHKLTEDQVREIRARWVPYKVSKPKLAAEYGVSLGLIENIVYRKAWKHI